MVEPLQYTTEQCTVTSVITKLNASLTSLLTRSHCFQEYLTDDPARLCMGLIFPPCRGRQLEYLADFVSNGPSRDSEIYYLKWRITISDYKDLKSWCIYIISSMSQKILIFVHFKWRTSIYVYNLVFYLSTDKPKGMTVRH